MKENLIINIDCSKKYDVNNYFEIGKTKVVHADIGSYRETSDTFFSRFGYRFELKNTQRLHKLVVRIPDDKRRFMCINDGTSYDLTTGITCGCVSNPSNKMIEVVNYFWPRWNDESIIFTNWGNNEPAGVSEFSVYEIDGDLPESALQNECYLDDRRSFGIQYEDPCNIGASEGAFDQESWTKRHIEYMKYTGQNTLTYPINWYHGPIIPVKSQPYGRVNTYIAPNRNQYVIASTHTPDWLSELLDEFDKNNFSFTGSMTLLRLGKLMESMNTNMDHIIHGEETYNNITYKGDVQSSTNDWTIDYNALTYPAIVKNLSSGNNRDAIYDRANCPHISAYGETRTNMGSAPIFNPIHPIVQDAVITLLKEIGEKYASHKSFAGIAINFWHSTLMWYGSLRVGYDDYSINLFEKETGIHLNIEPTDKDRFSKRYHILTTAYRDIFVKWRCEKIHDFICRCRDTLKSCRKDLKLTLTLWNETSYWSYLGIDTTLDSSIEYGERKSDYQVYRDGGIDLALYGGEENIEVAIERNSLRDCSNRSTLFDSNLTYEQATTNMFHDFMMLDTETQKVMDNLDNSTTFIFNCWVENFGRRSQYLCKKDDENLDFIFNKSSYHADCALIENSQYDDDTEKSFWFDSQCRITPAFPATPYFMEYVINELAIYDSLKITSGGICLDKAHSKEQLEFASEYRKLPKQKFNTLKSETDAAVVRWLFYKGKTYLYAVNREPYSITVNIRLADEVKTLEMKPFSLKVLQLNGEIIITGCDILIPTEAESYYNNLWNEISKLLADATNKSIQYNDVNMDANKFKNALHNKQYVFIRNFSKCHIIREIEYKLKEIARCS